MNARLIFSALFMVIATLSFAQSTTVKGVVTDKQGEPLIGVNVVEKVPPMVTSLTWTVILLLPSKKDVLLSSLM